jgi:hypothetical protein
VKDGITHGFFRRDPNKPIRIEADMSVSNAGKTHTATEVTSGAEAGGFASGPRSSLKLPTARSRGRISGRVFGFSALALVAIQVVNEWGEPRIRAVAAARQK